MEDYFHHLLSAYIDCEHIADIIFHNISLLLRLTAMFDFLKSIIESTRQTTSERLKSPFIGSFVFSWLALNWDALAIMFFSPKNIEARIHIVKQNHPYIHLFILPLIISISLCILLPWLNKFLIFIQTKPIDQATSLSMISRIKKARKQLTISRIEAKRELAKKREEKEIEENISATIAKSISLERLNAKLEKDLKKSNELISSLSIDNGVLNKTQSSNEQEIEKLKFDISELRKEKNEIHEVYLNCQTALSESQKDSLEISKEKEELSRELLEAKSYAEKLHNQFEILSDCLPNIFFGVSGDGNVQTTYEVMKNLIKFNDEQWNHKTSQSHVQSSTQFRMKVELSKLKDLVLELKESVERRN